VILPISRALCPDLQWRDSCPSTNTDLVARAAQLPDLAVLATADQTAGRGRLGRVWSAPAGGALAVSVFVLHQGIPNPRRLGWLPLIAGLAMVRSVRGLGVAGARLKWPNDVLVDELKLSGILTELTPHGVVIGAGLNLTFTRDDLPVPTATSLALQGVPTAAYVAPQGVPTATPLAPQGVPPLEGTPSDVALLDRALASYLGELFALVQQWRAVATPADLRPLVEAELHTLGRAVRVDRSGLPALVGTAVGLDDDGRLRVRLPGSASPSNSASPSKSANPVERIVAVAAGDVTHLRYE